MNKYISSIVYFFVEHNINNSRIITQGFAMRDTEVNNFGKNQTYKNPFGGNNARFYTFEYLYNKINSIRGKLKPLYFETDVLKFVINEELDDDIRVFNALWNGEDFNGFGESNKYGTLFLIILVLILLVLLKMFHLNISMLILVLKIISLVIVIIVSKKVLKDLVMVQKMVYGQEDILLI